MQRSCQRSNISAQPPRGASSKDKPVWAPTISRWTRGVCAFSNRIMCFLVSRDHNAIPFDSTLLTINTRMQRWSQMNRITAFCKHSLHIMHVPAPRQMVYSPGLKDFPPNQGVSNKPQNTDGEISREYTRHTLNHSLFTLSCTDEFNTRDTWHYRPKPRAARATA